MTASKLKLVKEEPTLRTALYCRFSSDVQNERSIERQTADLEKVAPRLNLKLDKSLYFEDRGTSATTLWDRPGLTRQLLGAAERRLFDAVLVEHTDRLSRKQADMFWLAEQFKMLGIKIFTPSGEVDPLRLTFESYQNEQFSIMLATRVRSGQNDAIREGRIPHKLGYGYSDVKDRPGEKAINEAEAEIIVRMFRECLSLKSARSIAGDLTKDGVLSPTGGAWTFQTVNQMLRNQIYVGIYARNKIRRARNYNTGKRDARPASPDELITVNIPRLAIVDRPLWDGVQRVLQDRSTKSHWKEKDREGVSRRLHPFAGLFRCAECGSKMIICGSIRGGDRSVACSTAWWRQTCPHRRSYSLARLTKHATDKMHEHLTDPDFVNERARERAKELACLEREASSERDTTQRELDRVDLKIKKLIRIAEDDDSEDVPQETLDRLKELRVAQRGLRQRLTLLDAKVTGVVPHPSKVKALARDVDTLHEMLRDDPDNPACRIALGNLIERALVHPTGYNQPYDVSLLARHAAYVGELPLFPEYIAKNSMENQAIARIKVVNAVVPS
jgi:DNA invertase Pin-like site-specific DNA recombinase